MDIHDTYYMLAAMEELPLEHTYCRDRYFPTNLAMDVFTTSKVFGDYREGNRRKAPFVLPRIGSLPVGREGFSTYELQPAYIGVSMPLTLDQLQKRQFGESIMSGLTPEDRARMMQLHDMDTLSNQISRTEEWLAFQTMLNNGCTMRHESDNPDVYEDVPAYFFDVDKPNPAQYTPAAPWEHSTVGSKGELKVGNWYEDIYQMVCALKRRGLPATDLLISSDVGMFLMEDPWVLKMLDNRRVEMGRITPEELTPNETSLGVFNFKGRSLEIIICEGTYENAEGEDVPYLDPGSVIVTAPNCGKCLYGAVSLMEKDEEFHTYAGRRIPQFIATRKPPARELFVYSAPLMVPVRRNPWCVAKQVFG